MTVPGAAMVMFPPPVAVKEVLPPIVRLSPATSASENDVAVQVASFVTASEAAPDTVSVTAPAETNVKLPPVLAALRSVAESSVMATTPEVLNVRVPKFTVPGAASVIAPPPLTVIATLPPIVNDSSAVAATLIAVELITASPVMAMTAVDVVSIAAADTSVSEAAPLDAVRFVAESS